MAERNCSECTESSDTCPINGEKCIFYSEEVKNGTTSEYPIRMLTRLINYEVQRTQETIKQLRSEGGFAYAVAYYRGHVAGLKRILDMIEWYAIKDESDARRNKRLFTSIEALVDDSLVEYADEATGNRIRLEHLKTIKRNLNSFKRGVG